MIKETMIKNCALSSSLYVDILPNDGRLCINVSIWDDVIGFNVVKSNILIAYCYKSLCFHLLLCHYKWKPKNKIL